MSNCPKLVIIWLGCCCFILSAAASSSACTTDTDCYLRGACVNSACVCDSWAIGTNCEYLNLAVVNKSHQGYLNASQYNTWGGKPILVGDTYHLFAAQMIDHCTLSEWTKVSEIIRAESTHFLGPYQMKQTVFPTFAHNPQITQAIDGTYLLYYIGVPNNIADVNCTQPQPQPQAQSRAHSQWNHNKDKEKLQLQANDSLSLPWSSGGPIRLGWSKSITGPWQTRTIVGSVQWHTSTNPSPLMFANGTVLLVVARRWCDEWTNTTADKIECTKHHKDTYIMKADAWNGTYVNVTQFPDGQMNGEDPFVFATTRGYHMLQHAGGASAGFFAYSEDAINWTQVTVQSFNATVRYSDGTSVNLCRRQRPQLLLDANNGEPMALFNGAMIQGNCSEVLPTWTLAQPFVGYE